MGVMASRNRDLVKQAWKIVAPASAAVFPLGLALGVLVVQSGLAWWWGPVIAAVVFAGSVEFLLVGMLSVAAPLTQIALSTFLVNFRHVFYAVSFPLHQVRGIFGKTYATFALTDEAYALTSPPQAQGWPSVKILTIQATFHLSWVASVAMGAGFGVLVPPQVVGLDFAITALFVALAMDAYGSFPSWPTPVAALVVSLAAWVLAPNHMLAVAMSLFVAFLVLSYAASRSGKGSANA